MTSGIEKVLAISTAHIRPETAYMLSIFKEGGLAFRHIDHEYGFIIFCSECFDDEDGEERHYLG